MPRDVKVLRTPSIVLRRAGRLMRWLDNALDAAVLLHDVVDAERLLGCWAMMDTVAGPVRGALVAAERSAGDSAGPAPRAYVAAVRPLDRAGARATAAVPAGSASSSPATTRSATSPAATAISVVGTVIPSRSTSALSRPRERSRAG